MADMAEFPYDRIWDMVIIGGGCAGLGCAIYASRNQFETLVLEKKFVGGTLALTYEVENYPGFFNPPISGMELTQKFEEHARYFGTKFHYAEAIKLENDGPYRLVHTNEGKVLRARTVTIAIGTEVNKLPAKNHDKFYGKGISYCATCDAPFFKDKRVIVVGGGESAFEEAYYLTRFAREVYLVHRRQQFRASPIAVERLRSAPNVEFILDTVVTEIHGNEQVEAVTLKNVKTKEERHFPTDGVFVFIGHHPRTEWLEGYLELERGYIKVNYQQETSVPGVYAAGDICLGAEKQAVISAGHGATAAIKARNYVDGINWPDRVGKEAAVPRQG